MESGVLKMIVTGSGNNRRCGHVEGSNICGVNSSLDQAGQLGI